MTQIAYDGKYLVADRKCYRGDGGVFLSKKIQQKQIGNELWTWAFSGDFETCEWGDKVLASGLDEKVIAKARDVLNADDVGLDGILVTNTFPLPSSPADDNHKVYLVSALGVKVELPRWQFVAVGALYEAVQAVGRTIGKYKLDEQYEFNGEPIIFVKAETAIRIATTNTIYDQTNCPIDVINISQRYQG